MNYKFLFAACMVLLVPLVGAYDIVDTVGEDDLYRIEDSYYIDFSTTLTDRFITPNDKVVFEEFGEGIFVQPVEATQEYLIIFNSATDTAYKITVGETLPLDFTQDGQADMEMTFLDGMYYKAHVDFAQVSSQNLALQETNGQGESSSSEDMSHNMSDEEVNQENALAPVEIILLIGAIFVAGLLAYWFLFRDSSQ